MLRYGMTLEEYVLMEEEQSGVCKICAQKCVTGRNLAVDHCHETGKIRGLLCQNCNTAIGKFGDDENRIKKAVEYLSESKLTTNLSAFNSTTEDYLLEKRSYIPSDNGELHSA